MALMRARALLALAGLPVVVAAEACAAGEECAADEASLLQTAAHGRSKGSLEAQPVSALEVAGLSEDLRRRNYQGREGLWCNGINAVGFDLAPKGGRGGYTVPSKEALRYFHDKGSNCFRVPITWERMQTYLGSDQAVPVGGFEETINYIVNTLGDYAIIDPHNNDDGLRYNGQDASRQDFVNLWKGIAKKWSGNPKIIFGLYNEPRYGYDNGRYGYFDPDALDFDGRMIELWRQWMQEAIDAVRRHSSNNIILVPGLHWTGSRDWSGAGWWGPSLDGVQRSGNTKLALLTDPANLIAYDVHQYMDGRFTGERVGCSGFDTSDFGGQGADWGLTQTIEWAKRYNKKLMMTEIGSWPTNDGSNTACKARMYDFLQRMQDSGVFIGYQVWQFGCPQCMADQWTLRPYNWDWYRVGQWNGNACAPDGADCRESQCCANPSKQCYEKDSTWASCRSSCAPGSFDPFDPPQYQTPWTCRLVGGSAPAPAPPPAVPSPPASGCAQDGADCRASRCCADPSKRCYEKSSSWASCRASCQAGQANPDDPPQYQTPWTCNLLDSPTSTCAADGADCRASKCCADRGKTCYEKNSGWASCRSTCQAGEANPLDPPEYRTPWTCKVVR